MSTQESLIKARDIVAVELRKRSSPIVKILAKMYRSVGDLQDAAAQVSKSAILVGKEEISNSFRASLFDIREMLDPVLSGYAYNGDVVMSEKAVEASKDQGAALAFFSEAIKTINDGKLGEQVARLREIDAVCKAAASIQSSGLSTPAVHKDPFQTEKTKETEGLPLPTEGTNNPAGAPTNWSVNDPTKMLKQAERDIAKAESEKNSGPVVWDFDMAASVRKNKPKR